MGVPPPVVGGRRSETARTAALLTPPPPPANPPALAPALGQRDGPLQGTPPRRHRAPPPAWPATARANTRCVAVQSRTSQPALEPAPAPGHRRPMPRRLPPWEAERHRDGTPLRRGSTAGRRQEGVGVGGMERGGLAARTAGNGWYRRHPGLQTHQRGATEVICAEECSRQRQAKRRRADKNTHASREKAGATAAWRQALLHHLRHGQRPRGAECQGEGRPGGGKAGRPQPQGGWKGCTEWG